MTKSKFQKLMKEVRMIHTDCPNGITDEMAYDMALNIMSDNKGLKEYIQKHIGASDAVGWLMCEI